MLCPRWCSDGWEPVTGRAVLALTWPWPRVRYCDDLGKQPGELYAALVLASKPHARLLALDATLALACEGVRGFFGAEDVPGDNAIGASAS